MHVGEHGARAAGPLNPFGFDIVQPIPLARNEVLLFPAPDADKGNLGAGRIPPDHIGNGERRVDVPRRSATGQQYLHVSLL